MSNNNKLLAKEKEAVRAQQLQQPQDLSDKAATQTARGECSWGSAQEQVKTAEQKFMDTVIARSPFPAFGPYIVKGKKTPVEYGYRPNTMELALEVAAILSKYSTEVNGEKRLKLRNGDDTKGGYLPVWYLGDAIWDSPRARAGETHKDEEICGSFLHQFTIKSGKYYWEYGLRIPGIEKRNYVTIGEILDAVIRGAEEQNTRFFKRVISKIEGGALV